MAEDVQPIAFSSPPSGSGSAADTIAAYANPNVGGSNVTDDGMNETNDN